MAQKQKGKPEPPCDARLQRGDDEEELLFPLRRDDVQKIKARASVCETTASAGAREVQKVWEVDGAVLESHNWRWREFLDERVTPMRATLGIAPTAVVSPSLKNLMLVEAGGSLCVPRGGEERGVGVFGTLLVVLPGAFEGGNYVVQHPESEGVDGDGAGKDRVLHTKTSWQPSARGSNYDMTYAVFYDHCAIVAEPVTSGTAFCLVYDLVTTTPGDIPLYAGPKRLQQFVDTALVDFFDVVPEPLVKRCKISDDAWRTVNAFVVDRPFVYIVNDDTFENLDDNEIKIMKSLASFCAQSGGQYVLYLAGACHPNINLTLKAPWIRYGELKVSEFPPVFLGSHHEVAPLEYCDRIGMWGDLNHADATVKAIVKEIHGEGYAHTAWTNALVLRDLIAESRDEALEYARRVVYYHPRWELCSDDMATFAEFVKIVVELNDLRLFNDVLLAVDLKCVDEHGALMSAVQHFEWEACRVSIVQRILSTSTVCGRANFVISVFHRRMESEQIDEMLQALLSLEPWTDVKVHAPERSDPDMCWLKSRNFKSLLGIASLSAPQKMIAVASVRDDKMFLHSVALAVVDLVERFPKVSSLRALLRHVWELLQLMLSDLRNEWHAQIRLRIHCPKCDELQSFLLSSATETTISFTSSKQRQHITSVISDAVTYESNADMSIRSAGESALRLIKKRRETIFCEGDFDAAEGLNKTMLALISPDGDQVNKDSPQHA